MPKHICLRCGEAFDSEKELEKHAEKAHQK